MTPSTVLAKIEEYLDLSYYLTNEMKPVYENMKAGEYDTLDSTQMDIPEPEPEPEPAIEPIPEPAIEPIPEVDPED